MNKLSLSKRTQILNMLVEGSSMRSISRVVGVSINTVTKLLIDAGGACQAHHNEHVQGVTTRRVECDEIWAFCYAKQKNAARITGETDYAGDVWTWTAIDSDSKLMLSWLVSPGRDSSYAIELMDDLRNRLANRVQLTTDGHKAYLEAVEGAFGGDVDYAQLVKIYASIGTEEQRRYSPARYNGSQKRAIVGNPNQDNISTSYVERQNLTMRMSMRRFTRLTNAFSKRVENHCHALALYFTYYNWVRTHKTLGVTPAMAAGLTDAPRSIEWIVGLIEGDSN